MENDEYVEPEWIGKGEEFLRLIGVATFIYAVGRLVSGAYADGQLLQGLDGIAVSIGLISSLIVIPTVANWVNSQRGSETSN